MPRTGDTRDAAREPAREAEFRRFVLATAVSVLGTYAAAIALAVRTYQDTGNPPGCRRCSPRSSCRRSRSASSSPTA